MAAPEYLICLNCESPCYTFEWVEGEATEARCLVCGNEEPDQFMRDEEFESMIGS
jgi:hypothetical protein